MTPPWVSRSHNMNTLTWLAWTICMVNVVVGQIGHEPEDNEFAWGTFPPGFMWGTATSAYQVEGAWDVQGKVSNVWDTLVHTGNKVANNDTGDVACNSYYKYREDVRLLKNMGVNHYRFSIAWSRILSNSTAGRVNQAGIDYYNRLINELISVGIVPMATLFHFDLPQQLEDIGGWYNENLIAHFKTYADVCFREFGDRVKHWMTFNEPTLMTVAEYGIGKSDPAEGPYKTSHVIIKAHAEAWHLYNDNYRTTQNGKVGIVLVSNWNEPRDPSDPLDQAASERSIQFSLGWYAYPILKNGDYPDVMREYVGRKSLTQGYGRSRLPTFTESEKARIAGTGDFFALNHYTSSYVYHAPNPNSEPGYTADQDIGADVDPSWPGSGPDERPVVPWGIRKLLIWIRNEYDNPDMYITENGSHDVTGTLNDDSRVYYFRYYINNVMKAVTRDGVNVRAYTAWSLMDNFEWVSGYSIKFGLHYVDFDDPARPRTAKDSAKYFSQIIKDNGFVDQSVGLTTTNPTNPGSRSNCISMISICVCLGIGAIFAFENS